MAVMRTEQLQIDSQRLHLLDSLLDVTAHICKGISDKQNPFNILLPLGGIQELEIASACLVNLVPLVQPEDERSGFGNRMVDPDPILEDRQAF